MSKISYTSIIILLFAITCANKTEESLDGKSYQLLTWDVNHPEKQDPDVLVFKNGMMDSEACHQYGFTAAAYTSTIKNGETSFSGTISSKTEGTIKIDGKVYENKIEGTMLWKKNGQTDIKYAYNGKLKK